METSAAVIAVFADMNNIEYAEEIYSKAVELGYMPAEVKETQLPTIKGLFETVDREQLKDINLIDAGLVSMQLMLVARAHGYDTNPIGGEEKKETAQAFGADVNPMFPLC